MSVASSSSVPFHPASSKPLPFSETGPFSSLFREFSHSHLLKHAPHKLHKVKKGPPEARQVAGFHPFSTKKNHNNACLYTADQKENEALIGNTLISSSGDLSILNLFACCPDRVENLLITTQNIEEADMWEYTKAIILKHDCGEEAFQELTQILEEKFNRNIREKESYQQFAESPFNAFCNPENFVRIKQMAIEDRLVITALDYGDLEDVNVFAAVCRENDFIPYALYLPDLQNTHHLGYSCYQTHQSIQRAREEGKQKLLTAVNVLFQQSVPTRSSKEVDYPQVLFFFTASKCSLCKTPDTSLHCIEIMAKPITLPTTCNFPRRHLAELTRVDIALYLRGIEKFLRKKKRPSTANFDLLISFLNRNVKHLSYYIPFPQELNEFLIRNLKALSYFELWEPNLGRSVPTSDAKTFLKDAKILTLRSNPSLRKLLQLFDIVDPSPLDVFIISLGFYYMLVKSLKNESIHKKQFQEILRTWIPQREIYSTFPLPPWRSFPPLRSSSQKPSCSNSPQEMCISAHISPRRPDESYPFKLEEGHYVAGASSSNVQTPPSLEEMYVTPNSSGAGEPSSGISFQEPFPTAFIHIPCKNSLEHQNSSEYPAPSFFRLLTLLFNNNPDFDAAFFEHFKIALEELGYIVF